MNLSSKRIKITNLNMEMAKDIQKNSIDEDNKRFVPDEVFETMEDAQDAIAWLISSYQNEQGPFLYPVLLQDDTNIGYVQACRIEDGWEVGYHIAKDYTGNGYATEAVQLFLPEIMKKVNIDKIYGVVLKDNVSSQKILQKCGFELEYEKEEPYQGVPRLLQRYIYHC